LRVGEGQKGSQSSGERMPNVKRMHVHQRRRNVRQT
jgi:hypothetical protein